MAKDDMVRVSTAELAELLGLPADTPEEVLLRKFYEGAAALAAQEEAQAVAAAEAAACAEDRRIVNAAYNAGKFPASRVEFWTDALKRDRERNRALVASLTPGLVQVEKSSPRTVAASGDPFADGRERALLDSVGLPMPDAPRAHVIKKGKDPQTWTREEQRHYYSHKLGGPFAIGVPKPPAGDQIYIDSPTAPYRWDAASQQFVERNPYREI